MYKTYTYKIKPNKAVERKFYEWCGITRFVYNCALELKMESYKKGLKLSNYDIQKQLTIAKKDFTFIKNVANESLNASLDRLDKSYKCFFKGSGYPKFASKNNWRSIHFKRPRLVNNSFVMPVFGSIKVFSFKAPKGIIKTASIVKEADGLYLKIIVKESIAPRRESQSICAIDMGIKYFLTTSDGVFVDNPRHLFEFLKKLRIENRKLSRMKKGGSNWIKQVEVLKRLYQKISRVRKDFLHKQSRILSNDYSTVIIENLNVSGMAKNSRLSKHILDCSWATFFQLLSYKTEVIKVNPAYSSQDCFKCGHRSKENRKTQSLFECVSCGHLDNADLNAANNLLKRGQSLLEANVSQ